MQLTAVLVIFVTLFEELTAQLKLNSKELKNFSEVLFEHDYSGITPKELNVHFGSHTSLSEHTDKASNRLFGANDFKKMEQDTYVKMLALGKYFKPNTKETEEVSDEKTKAIYAWLDAVIQSEIMEMTRKFLLNKGFAQAGTKGQFKNYLYTIWFTTYSRGARSSSSGFEHVFVYDMDIAITTGKKELKGLHNWLRFQQLEENHVVDYAGYSQKREQAINAVFRIDGEWKTSSFLIGTSPELDLALYTLCFVYGSTSNNDRIDCTIKMIDCALATISVFKQKAGSDIVIGTAYPGIDSSTRSGCPPGYRKDTARENLYPTGSASSNLQVTLVFWIAILIRQL